MPAWARWVAQLLMRSLNEMAGFILQEIFIVHLDVLCLIGYGEEPFCVDVYSLSEFAMRWFPKEHFMC